MRQDLKGPLCYWHIFHPSMFAKLKCKQRAASYLGVVVPSGGSIFKKLENGTKKSFKFPPSCLWAMFKRTMHNMKTATSYIKESDAELIKQLTGKQINKFPINVRTIHGHLKTQKKKQQVRKRQNLIGRKAQSLKTALNWSTCTVLYPYNNYLSYIHFVNQEKIYNKQNMFHS